MTARCAIVGTGALAVQCAELVRSAGFDLRIVSSSDSAVTGWAAEKGVPLGPVDDVDYLFSVVNPTILPPETLARPRRLAINYHDGPLPRYAGLNATTWALLAGEREHGVSWHVMVAEPDAGDLLVTRTVPVEPDDTAHRLNLRCHAAALDAFTELLHRITAGTLCPVPQDLSRRTYFSRRHRPPAGGVLDWRRPTAELDRLVRALDFGDVPNPVAWPALVLSDRVAYVRALRPEQAAVAEPGTVLAVDGGWLVRTGDGAVRLTRVVDRYGDPVDLGGRPGDRLPEPGWEHDEAAAAEPAWVRALLDVRPALPPPLHLPPAAGPAPTAAYHRAASGDVADVLAGLADCLCRVNHADAVDVAWEVGGPGLYSPTVPLRLDVVAGEDRAERALRLRRRLDRIRRRGPYRADVVGRYPWLRGRPRGRAALPIAVRCRTEPAAAGLPDSVVTVDIHPDSVTWWYDPAVCSIEWLTGRPRPAHRRRATGPTTADLIREHATRRPDAVAVRTPSGVITYGELASRPAEPVRLRTRGSGRPVTMAQDALGVAASAAAVALGIGPDDVVPLWSERGTWPWLVQWAATLAGGGTVLVATEPGTEATVVLGTPYQVGGWAARLLAGEVDPDACAVRSVCVLGDPAPARVLTDLRTALWDVEVRVGYGVTGDGLLVSVDEVLGHVAARVVDRSSVELPAGVVGRLQVSTGGEWRDTDDLARLDEHGRLSWVSRVDRTLCRGGYRIDPAWIEDGLRTHPAVREAVVRQEGAAVVADVTVTGGLTGRDLRRIAGAAMPTFLLPDEVRVVPGFHPVADRPTTATGPAAPLRG